MNLANNIDTLTTRQKMAIVCYFAVKYGRLDDKGRLTPPPELGDTFTEFYRMMGQHYDKAPSTISRLCDYFIARFPKIPQMGFRIDTDPDDARRPEPMSGPVNAVYSACKRVGRVDLFQNVVSKLIPRPYSRRKPRTTPGFAADDNNTKPRVRDKNETETKGRVEINAEIRKFQTQGRPVQIDLEGMLLKLEPNMRITRLGDNEVKVENI